MANKRLELKCEIAIKSASDWRSANNAVGKQGFVLTYGPKAFEFCTELPRIGGRNPIAVDADGDCFIPLNKSAWQCVTAPEKMISPKRNGEHISVLLKEGLLFSFNKSAHRIHAWFDACTVPITEPNWAKLERLTLSDIYKKIVAGVAVDSILNARQSYVYKQNL